VHFFFALVSSLCKVRSTNRTFLPYGAYICTYSMYVLHRIVEYAAPTKHAISFPCTPLLCTYCTYILIRYFFFFFEVYVFSPQGGARGYEMDPSRAFKGLGLRRTNTLHKRPAFRTYENINTLGCMVSASLCLPIGMFVCKHLKT